MPIKPFVGGNWKSNGTQGSVKELVQVLNDGKFEHDIDIVVCPTYLQLDFVKNNLKNDKIQIAAQNCIVKSGAFTGEVSAEQLVDFGLPWVVLGHSERRKIFGETDEGIAEKVAAAQKAGLSVIACIGETLEEREENKTMDVCTTQLKAICGAVQDWSKTVIAYEPVWAIGTGKTATPQQAQEVHANLRKWLKENVSETAAQSRILYGGSVNEKNCTELYAEADINGFLVGGASLKPAFIDICKAANTPK
eukprot:NODE_405_length_867_cov_413.239189_g397_i0.p1 GENE.NODE_405_length_867_cov_413.239189_g397_i0~~NODE_405_length_867_cov_413.239189_g397_i0.p1  ORF type:complete len:262 (-),score=78.57 NODE_405_length_867_cov_413.239189_g397_i0:82-831(-)